MTLTSNFHDTVRERADNDAEFRISLLETSAESIISGDLNEGKAALRLYIKSTTGYKHIADLAGIHPKSLIRMLGPKGNPRVANLAAILSLAIKQENINLVVKATSAESPTS